MWTVKDSGRRVALIFSICLLLASAGCGEGSGFEAGKNEERSGESTAAGAGNGSEPQTGPAGTPSTARPPSDAFPEESKPSLPSSKIIDPGKPGPYQVQSYTDPNLSNAAYQSAQIFYPADAPMTMTLPGTSLSGGFTNVKEDMTWLAQHLASHGFIVLAFTPTNNLSLDPLIWSTGHKGSLEVLKAENQRDGSPIKSRLKTEKLGIMGFSMGGAGTIVAVNELGASGVQAAVPICAFQPQLPTAAVPMMLLTGTRDTIAVPGNVVGAYNSMNTGASKALANFNGLVHLDVVQAGSPVQHENIARFATSWYLVHLSGQGGYKTYLDGDENKRIRSTPSVFALEADFHFQP